MAEESNTQLRNRNVAEAPNNKVDRQQQASRMMKMNAASGAKDESSKWRYFCIAAVFCLFLVGIYFSYHQLNGLSPDDYMKVKLPRSIEDAKQLGQVLLKYKQKNNNSQLTFTFFFIYIFLQTFMIPGSIFMSVIAGFLYPTVTAMFFVCASSAIGATGCYIISLYFGGNLAQKQFPDKIENWKKQVDKRRDDLFSYLLFLRITPLVPNWLINIASPLIDIPMGTFFFATFIGVAPLSYLAVSSGTQLNSMVSSDLSFSWFKLLYIFVFALVAMLPVLYKKYFTKQGDDTTNKQE